MWDLILHLIVLCGLGPAIDPLPALYGPLGGLPL